MSSGAHNDKTPTKVVELLKREFEEKRVSKYAFCKKTGINPTSVERYLYGITEPTKTSLEKLAEYFGMSVSYLRGETEPVTCCPHCGGEINPGSLLGKGKKKTMTPAAFAARRANAAKPRKKEIKR